MAEAELEDARRAEEVTAAEAAVGAATENEAAAAQGVADAAGNIISENEELAAVFQPFWKPPSVRNAVT